LRTPDIITLPHLGVIYASSKATKIAEHGGFSDDDTNVPLLVVRPGAQPGTIFQPVTTTQVAATILSQLGLDPSKLQAVQMEAVQALPGLPLTSATSSTGGPAGPNASELTATQAGALTGNSGGVYATYQISNPLGSALTLTLTYGPPKGGNGKGIDIEVYQAGAKIGGAIDTSDKGVLSLSLTPAKGSSVLIKVGNYIPGYTVDYTLTQE